MNLLKFELLKILKQKKYIWVLIAVFLFTGALFWVNSYQRSRLQGNWARYSATSNINFMEIETERLLIEREMIEKQLDHGLDTQEENQLVYLGEMGVALQRVRLGYYFGKWEFIHRYEQMFLVNLEQYIEVGGELSSFPEAERELVVARNSWFMDHDIPYELEKSPVTQHLFLLQSSSFLFGLMGIAILVVLFGNTLVEEKENMTLLTLNTQPISNTKLLLSKYFMLLMMTLIYTFMVIVMGLLIPFIFDGWSLIINYPQVLGDENNFLIIPISQYILRSGILFFLACSVILSISMIVNKWVTKSLRLYFVMGIIIGLGYLSTTLLQSPLNPFYLLTYNLQSPEAIQGNHLLHLLVAVTWSAIFVIIAINIPDRQSEISNTTRGIKPFLSGRTNLQGGQLRKLYIFEWRKYKREGMLKVISIPLLVVILSGFFLVNYQTEKREIAYMDELKYRVSGQQVLYYEEMIDSLLDEKEDIEERFKETDPVYDIYMSSIEEQIAMYEELIEYEIEQQYMVKAALEGYNEGDWTKFYQYQHFVNQQAVDHTNSFEFTKLVSMHEKELLMDRNIQPVMSGEFIPTIHQYRSSGNCLGWGGKLVGEREWERQNKKVDNSGFFFLYLSFTHYFYLIPIVLLLLLVGGGIAKEKGKKRTFDFLKTQPLSREKIYLTKVINSLSVALISIITVTLLMVLVGTVFNRLGDWNYPILFYAPYSEMISPDFIGFSAGGHGYYFITLTKYLLHSVVLLLALSFLIIATSNFIALFINKTLFIWVATIMIGVWGYWYNGRYALRISSFSPFTYFNIPKIVNGQLATKLNDPRVNVLTGLIVLLSLTGAIIILGYYIEKRKRITAKTNIA